MKMIIGLIVLLISASAFADQYARSVASWRGLSASHLVSKWGLPDTKIIQPNGESVYVYYVDSYPNYPQYRSPMVGVNVNAQGRPVIVTTPTDTTLNRPIMMKCAVRFVVSRGGIIVGTRMSGNGCGVGSWPINPYVST